MRTHGNLSAGKDVLKRSTFRVLSRVLGAASRARSPRIVVYTRHPAFERPVQAVADLLQSRGMPVVTRQGFSFGGRASMHSSRDLWIGFWFRVPTNCLPKNYVVWNPEPLDQPRSRTGVTDEWYETLAGAAQVWEYKRENAPEHERRGIDARYVPFGYARHHELAYARSIAGMDRREDIDVLFFGSMCERREYILSEIAARGHNVFVANDERRAYGSDLDRLLARSKIVLGIHSFEEPIAQIADLARVGYPLSNRRFVIHERPAAPRTDPAFEQFVPSPEFDHLVECVEYYLAAPEARALKAEQAYAWYKANYPLEHFIPFTDVARILAELP